MRGQNIYAQRDMELSEKRFKPDFDQKICPLEHVAFQSKFNPASVFAPTCRCLLEMWKRQIGPKMLPLGVDLGEFPRSTLIHSQKSGQVFVDGLDIKTKWEWRLRNHSIDLKFSSARPSCPSVRPQCSVVNFCTASESLLSRCPWEGRMEKKGRNPPNS